MTRLYYHKTDGGAEYLCTSPVDGTDEGDLHTAVIRLDGQPELLGDFETTKADNRLKQKQGNIPLRKRDLLVIKIVDWSDDKPSDEPAIDLEVYVKGEFKFDLSHVYPVAKGKHSGDTKRTAILKAMSQALKVTTETLI